MVQSLGCCHNKDQVQPISSAEPILNCREIALLIASVVFVALGSLLVAQVIPHPYYTPYEVNVGGGCCIAIGAIGLIVSAALIFSPDFREYSRRQDRETKSF